MDWQRDLVGLLVGFVLAAVTTPVGVSGAVFLLPVQLSVLHVPNPRVTPTNLLFNVISGPGGLARYRRRGQFDRTLTLQLLAGSVPGVVLGAVIRVYVVADPDVFRLLAAAVLAPVGLFILRKPAPGSIERRLSPLTVRALAFTIGDRGRRLRDRRRLDPRADPRRHRDGGRHGGPRRPVLHLGDLAGRGRDVRRDLAGCHRADLPGLVARRRHRPRRSGRRLARSLAAAAASRSERSGRCSACSPSGWRSLYLVQVLGAR